MNLHPQMDAIRTQKDVPGTQTGLKKDVKRTQKGLALDSLLESLNDLNNYHSTTCQNRSLPSEKLPHCQAQAFMPASFRSIHA